MAPVGGKFFAMQAWQPPSTVTEWLVLANFFQLFLRRSTGENYRRAFVVDVRPVTPREPRNRRSERFILIGWGLIGLKCWGVIWLIHKYQVPVGPWWINGPTLAAATLVSIVYLRRP